jgi:kynurenine formamidase
MDAPAHMLEGGKKISEMEGKRFFCQGVAVDARGRTELGPELLVGHDITSETAIVFWTGWAEKFGQNDYFENFPTLNNALVKQLCVDKPSLILLDTPSPDHPPYLVHQALFKSEILIVENIKPSAEMLEWDNFYIAALPLKLETDASPCRVLAIRL